MLDNLPYEVIEQIAAQDRLTPLDLANLASVCGTLKDVCNSNSLWQKKFARRWPRRRQVMKEISGQVDSLTNWKAWFKKRYICSSEVQMEIQKMSSYYYKKAELSEEAFYVLKLFLDQQFGFDFVVDELFGILYDSDIYTSLTLKYYARKAMRYVQHTHLQAKWQEYLALPPYEQSFEKGMVMACQWFQPLEIIDEEIITKQLDEITESVKKQLAVKFPNHPVLKCDKVEPVNLTQTLWSTEETRRLLKVVCEVIFVQYGFNFIGDDDYGFGNYMLDKVLISKNGVGVALAILFLCIARRLGVVCELDLGPSHVYICWKEYPTAVGIEQYTGIDMSNKGAFVSLEMLRNGLDLPVQHSPHSVTATEVVNKLARSMIFTGKIFTGWDHVLLLVRSAAELLLTVCPFEIDTVMLLCRIYLELNINLQEVICRLQDVQQRFPAWAGVATSMTTACYLKMSSSWIPVEPVDIVGRKRPLNEDVLFHVGLIMRHKKYHYMCVIIGWDSMCMETQEWMSRMGIHTLSRKQHQPFYSVLVDDGSTRYAAQENLEVHPEPRFIHHPQIGKYFSEYKGSYFVSNVELAKEYPEDDALKYVK